MGRQYRITVDNEHYRVDLVFYHRFLRCFVLIDLKIEKLKHHDIGQMNIEFATYGMSSQLFVSKYQLYLPNEAELRAKLEEVLLER